jgi:acyl-ACP thioesterase
MNYAKNDHALDSDPPLIKSRNNYEGTYEHKVMYGEVDYNGHVNNTRYLDWCLNSIPVEFHREYCFNKLSINFLAEVKENEHIILQRSAAKPGKTYFSGKRQSDGKNVFRSGISWTKRGGI